MAIPEYLICMECETPTYVFEWGEGKAIEVLCPMCGNEDPSAFATEEEFEDMGAAMAEEESEE